MYTLYEKFLQALWRRQSNLRQKRDQGSEIKTRLTLFWPGQRRDRDQQKKNLQTQGVYKGLISETQPEYWQRMWVQPCSEYSYKVTLQNKYVLMK